MFFGLNNGIGVSFWFAFVLGYLISLVFAFVMHEYAHASVAVREGDMTPKMMGRLTINPIRHIDPFGLIMLLVLGFGYARPVPVCPQNFRRGRLSDFLVAGAGVFTNLCIAVCLIFVKSILIVFAPKVFESYNFFAVLLSVLLQYGIWINLSLAFFNLIPVAPLDGFRLLASILGARGQKFVDFMEKYQLVFMIVLIVVSMVGFNFIGYLASLLDWGLETAFVKFFRLF